MLDSHRVSRRRLALELKRLTEMKEKRALTMRRKIFFDKFMGSFLPRCLSSLFHYALEKGGKKYIDGKFKYTKHYKAYAAHQLPIICIRLISRWRWVSVQSSLNGCYFKIKSTTMKMSLLLFEKKRKKIDRMMRIVFFFLYGQVLVLSVSMIEESVGGSQSADRNMHNTS